MFHNFPITSYKLLPERVFATHEDTKRTQTHGNANEIAGKINKTIFSCDDIICVAVVVFGKGWKYRVGGMHFLPQAPAHYL